MRNGNQYVKGLTLVSQKVVTFLWLNLETIFVDILWLLTNPPTHSQFTSGAWWVTVVTPLIVTVTPLLILRVHACPIGQASAASLLARTWPRCTRSVLEVVVAAAVFTEKTCALAATIQPPGHRAEWSRRFSPRAQCGSTQHWWIPGRWTAAILAAWSPTVTPP